MNARSIFGWWQLWEKTQMKFKIIIRHSLKMIYDSPPPHCFSSNLEQSRARKKMDWLVYSYLPLSLRREKLLCFIFVYLRFRYITLSVIYVVLHISNAAGKNKMLLTKITGIITWQDFIFLFHRIGWWYIAQQSIEETFYELTDKTPIVSRVKWNWTGVRTRF